MMRRYQALAAVLCVLAVPAQAYYHYVHYSNRNGANPQLERFNVKTVAFYVSGEGPDIYAPNDTFGSLLGQVKQALAAWDSVSTSDLRVVFGGLAGQNQAPNAPRGDVVFDDLPPGLLGMGMPVANGTTIVRSTVKLANNTNNGAGPSYYEKFFTTAVHEVGHALGLQHTWASSAMSQDVIRNTSRAHPLDADDIAALNLLYGTQNWQADYGSVSGRVTFTNGAPVALASVVAINPTGPAVSALTAPDGSYRIDGIPEGNYLLYVHPLPPDAIPADESGLRLPRDQNNQPIPASPSAFAAQFYPGTTEAGKASALAIRKGALTSDQNFTVQAKGAVAAYDLITYSFLDQSTGRSFWDDGNPNRRWARVSPAFIDSTQTAVTIKISAAYGDTPMPQAAQLLGGFAVTQRGPWLRSFFDSSTGYQSMVLDLGIPLFAGLGARHLVLNYGNDMYVLPAAANLVQRPVPVVTSVNPNADGTTVTITGKNMDPRVYFDGLPATILTASATSITVIPPPGVGGHTAIVTVFNADGQNSLLLGEAPPTYTYPDGGAPQISNVSVRTLPAGSTSMVEITTRNMRLTDGKVTLGFGSDDITVQRLWVTGDNSLRANLITSGNAAPGSYAISVVTGFQVASMPDAFTVLPPLSTAGTGIPVVWLPIANGDATQKTVYPGSAASIYGSGFGQNISAIQVLLNDRAVPLLGLAPDHVNILIPSDFPKGPAVVKVRIGLTLANPVLLQIDGAPPSIVQVTNSSGVNYDATHFASASDVINVIVTGLDPAVLNSPARVSVTVSGITMPPPLITQLDGGQYQLQFVLTQGFGSTMAPVAVVVDGSSSAPYLIPVR